MRRPAPARTRDAGRRRRPARRARASRGRGSASRGSCPGWRRRPRAGRAGGHVRRAPRRARSRRRRRGARRAVGQAELLAVLALELAGVAAGAEAVGESAVYKPRRVSSTSRSTTARRSCVRLEGARSGGRPRCRRVAAQRPQEAHLRAACPSSSTTSSTKSSTSRIRARVGAPRLQAEVDHLAVQALLEGAELVLLDHRPLVDAHAEVPLEQAVELGHQGLDEGRDGDRLLGPQGMSQMRNSRVLKYAWGRTSHQIFLPSSMQLVRTRRSTYFAYSSQER